MGRAKFKPWLVFQDESSPAACAMAAANSYDEDQSVPIVVPNERCGLKAEPRTDIRW